MGLQMREGSQEYLTLASITKTQACHRLKYGRRRGRRGVGVGEHSCWAQLWSQAERPKQSEPLGEMDAPTHLFALALGYFLSGATGAPAAYSVHTALPGLLRAGRYRRGVSILHQEGVSFNKRRRCPCPPGVRLSFWLSLSPAPSLLWMELQEKGWAPTTHNTHTVQVVFPALGLGEPEEEATEWNGREATLLGRLPGRLMLVYPQKAQGQTLSYLFLPLPCDLIIGLDTKAVWRLDSCPVKRQLSRPSCLHASLH